MIGGLRSRDAGQVSVAGFDPQEEPRELRELLGMQLQVSRQPAKIAVRSRVTPAQRPLIVITVRSSNHQARGRSDAIWCGWRPPTRATRHRSCSPARSLETAWSKIQSQ